MFDSSLLLNIILLPLIGAIIILFINDTNVRLIKNVALAFSMASFTLSTFLWVLFDRSTAKFQFVEEFLWIPSSNINFFIGVDGISLFFILLTTLLVPLCLLASFDSVKIYVKEYMIAFLVMEALLIIVFSILDLLLFYVFFESVLIPMFLIVGVWGSRERKVRAAYMLFLYTLIGSVLMLLAILLMYSIAGTTDYQVLLTTPFNESLQKNFMACFFCFVCCKSTYGSSSYLVT